MCVVARINVCVCACVCDRKGESESTGVNRVNDKQDGKTMSTYNVPWSIILVAKKKC